MKRDISTRPWRRFLTGDPGWKNELTETTRRFETLLKTSERKNQVREAVVLKLQAIESVIEETGIKAGELARIKKRVEAEATSAEADLNMCRSRLASLEGLTENFEGYKVGVRTIMKARDFPPGNQGRVLGILADLIQVDPHYEKAVEAVLADKLQYVIMMTTDDAAAAVQYLKEKSRGIGSFAPIGDCLYAEKNGKIDAGFFAPAEFRCHIKGNCTALKRHAVQHCRSR